MSHKLKRSVGFLFVFIAVAGFWLTKPNDGGSEDSVEVLTTWRMPSVTSTDSTSCYIYVSGAVKNPGVYVFDQPIIMIDAIDEAGGFLAEADTEDINLAKQLQTNEMIEIPFLKSDETEETEETIWIEIAGEVHSPGMYEMSSGARVYEVLDKAGGMTEIADRSTINLAGFLADGQKITIPTISEDEDDLLEIEVKGAVISPGSYEVVEDATIIEVLVMVGLADGADPFGLDLSASVTDGMIIDVPYEEGTYPEKINLNEADKDLLMTLPGIGDTIARRIITFRETIRPFTSVEDIMLIDGIGFATYEELKAYLTV